MIIGEGDDALLCMTDNTECCRPPDDGEFFYPDGTAVGFKFLIQEQRGTSGVRLNRRSGATIPDTSGSSDKKCLRQYRSRYECPYFSFADQVTLHNVRTVGDGNH